MTLEDFFTLTEMKEGLTAPARVKELLNEMQKANYDIGKNAGDTTRQWSAVASTIAATENKDCIDFFLQLDGLSYFDSWLKDAQKFGNEKGDSFVEESIISLLGAVEKLQIINQKKVISGILMTVENLFSHNSSKVQDKARALLDSWKQNNDSNVVPQDVNSESPECPSQDISCPGSSAVAENNVELEPARDEMMPAICSETIQAERIEDVNVQTSDNTLDQASLKDGPLSPVCSSDLLKPVNENNEDNMPPNLLESNPDVEKDVDAREDICPKVSGDCRTNASEGEGRMGNSRSPSPCRNIMASESTGQIDECNVDVLQTSISELKLGKSEDPATYLSTIEDTMAIEESNEHDDDTDQTEDNLGNDLDFSRPEVNANCPDVINRIANLEVDYGTFDPLEVARQVAIEVEREVDGREPSCSSSERMSGGGIGPPDSPGSINGKTGRVVPGPSKDMPTEPIISPGAFINTVKLITEQESCVPDMDSSSVTELAQKTEPNHSKRRLSFDLNEEVFSDDIGQEVIPIVGSIPVVPASRASAASGLPLGPLQFDGTLGWKGSAETSAFRAAPPSSKQRHGSLDFDLNVAEIDEDIITELMKLGKEIPMSSGFPSGDSSIEAGPGKSDRAQLDLNRVSDGGDAPSNWRREGLILQNRNGHHHSPSPSSSSSSMQPSLRNFDLNDQPSLFNEFPPDPAFNGKSSQNLTTSGGFKPNDSVISLLGARVDVNQTDFVSQTIRPPNGRISDPATAASSTRTGNYLGLGPTLPYGQSAFYGYNGPSSGPTIPFSSAMYGFGGHVPYMVDSRGSPVVPQIMGSASAIPPALSQSPYIMSMTGVPSGSNGVGPMQHNFDLNSGLMMEPSRDTNAGLRLFNSGQGRSTDEQMRPNSQSSSSSGVGGKRKEIDGGWDPHPFNYKHHQPPWK